MLGIATVDAHLDTIAVWLTSRTANAAATHTNAVVFQRADLDLGRVRGMLWDRRVFLTPRTPGLFLDGEIPTCDLQPLANEVAEAQRDLMAQFEVYRQGPGKADLIEPSWMPVPDLEGIPTMGADYERPANEATLAMADLVRRTWTAWLSTEAERAKRSYMEPRDRCFRELPPKFIKHSEVYK